MRAKIEAFTEPVRIYVLMKRPGEPAARKMRLPGDMGGVEAAIMFSYITEINHLFNISK